MKTSAHTCTHTHEDRNIWLKQKSTHKYIQPNRWHKRLKSDNLRSLNTPSLHKFRKHRHKQGHTRTHAHTAITLLICMYPRLICASYYPGDNRNCHPWGRKVCVWVCVCWGWGRQTECCVHCISNSVRFSFTSPDAEALLTWFPRLSPAAATQRCRWVKQREEDGGWAQEEIQKMSGCTYICSIYVRKRWGKYKELKKKKAAVWMEMIQDYCSVSTRHKNLSFLQKQPEDKVRRKMLVGTVAAKRGCSAESPLIGNKVIRNSYFWDVKAKHFRSSLLLKSTRFWHPVSRGSKTSADAEKKTPQLRTISLKLWIANTQKATRCLREVTATSNVGRIADGDEQRGPGPAGVIPESHPRLLPELISGAGADTLSTLNPPGCCSKFKMDPKWAWN